MASEDSSAPPRYVVGLDLGTTNSALAYVDTSETPTRIRSFTVPQVVAAGTLEALETLPSFHYQPAAGEFSAGALRLPWQKSDPAYTVGMFARDQGTLSPARLINSAKSWLCHPGVDRTAEVLPWQGASDVDRLSPVTVSARYLQHYREAWDARFPDQPLAAQDFVLTLPASFDEVARELTIRAAQQAGLPRVVLIEEPQAAFYAWIDKHVSFAPPAKGGNGGVIEGAAPKTKSTPPLERGGEDVLNHLVSPGQKILVCDIGGGTTDFTLIRVRRGADGLVQFHRVAVGEHLILGGDNFDLALAHHLEHKLKGDGRLEPRQWSSLVRHCRQVKEILLGEHPPERYTLTLPGAGSKLIGGGLQVPVTREEVEQVVVEGFFPLVPLDAQPTRAQSGFQEFGLPYAPDPAVTKYLAAFLTAHRFAGDDTLVPSPPSAGGRVRVRGASASDDVHSQQSPSRMIQSMDVLKLSANTLRKKVEQELAASSSFFPPAKGGLGGGERRVDSQPARTPPNPPSERGGDEMHDPARPDMLLFNGGVFESPMLRQRLIDQLHAWFRTNDPRWSLTVLDNDRLDLAVARGAAYYGMVRRGQGVRIAAGLARTYYIGVEGSPGMATPGSLSALCLCPAGLEPGHDIDLTQRQFELRLGEPIEFPLFYSSTRLTDRPVELVPIEREQLTALPPIRTVLKAAKTNETGTVRVHLQARLTEIGTLDLWCAELDGKRRWKLLFDVRSATQTDVAATASTGAQQGVLDDAVREAACTVIARTFQTGGDEPGGLMKRLSETIDLSREDWPTTLLRQLWETLVDVAAGRKLSPQHEARWLNLLGFSLRPGYGLAVDDWRVAETWKLIQGKLAFGVPMCRVETWILWRRVAGGLAAGQQQALAAPLSGTLREWVKSGGKPRSDGVSPHELAEQCRLLGSLEWLSPPMKQQLGTLMLDIAEKTSHAAIRSAALWAVGRIGARRPVYGPLNAVVSPEIAEAWINRVMSLTGSDPMESFAAMQLARKTDDRYRDINEHTRGSLLKWMDRVQSPKHFRRLVRETGTLEAEEQGLVFGESLPQGLRIL
jgi:hypothetical protein